MVALDRFNEIPKSGYFIHIPKTGGTYVWRKDWLESGEIPMNDAELKVVGHRSCVHRKATYGDFIAIDEGVLDRSVVFSVVRNPYDLLASHYHSSKNGEMVGWRWCNRDNRIRSFKEFIEKYCDESFDWSIKPLHENLFFQIFKSNGDCATDFVIRFEEMNDGLKFLGNLFGAKVGSANRVNSSTCRPSTGYDGLYDKEMVEMVEKKCRVELDLFGYSYSGYREGSIVETGGMNLYEKKKI